VTNVPSVGRADSESVIEKSGIPTASITLLPEITDRVVPPRVLVVDRLLGYPFGEPHSASAQTAIIMAALKLTRVAGVMNVMRRRGVERDR
jgi:D-proline reductase (dithiol) PrdB